MPALWQGMTDTQTACPPRERIQKAFEACLSEFSDSPIVRRIVSGECSVEAYQGILTQIFFQTRENPQLQGFATMRFRGSERTQVGTFLAHARSEVGHDEMARQDLATLGCDVEDLPSGNPLPATSGLVSFAFQQALCERPAGYLGYLFFLEFTPTEAGQHYREGLLKAGIPAEAMTFLDEHIGIDPAHNRLMEVYLEELLLSDADVEHFIFSMKTTAKLYELMLEQGAEVGFQPQGFGKERS